MPRNPKMPIHGAVYEVCFRTEEGLPLTAAGYMKKIVEGYLAAAQSKYPVTICHYVVMANHLHLLIVAKDPEDVSRFVLYYKRETAHAINRLQGRRGRTVWCEGYDSPIVLDAEKAIERIVYLYLNPAKADLVESIDEYPNLSSWNAFLSDGESRKCRRIPRSKIKKLPRRDISLKEAEKIAAELIKASTEQYELKIEPFAWMKAFEQTRSTPTEIVKTLIVEKLREKEKFLSMKKGRKVLGPEALIGQSIFEEYVSEKHSKKMICLGSSKLIRKSFIEFYKAKVKQARLAVQQIRAGLSVKMPPAFFHPGGFLHANILPRFTPLPLG